MYRFILSSKCFQIGVSPKITNSYCCGLNSVDGVGFLWEVDSMTAMTLWEGGRMTEVTGWQCDSGDRVAV